MLVNRTAVLELKVVERILPIHAAQLLGYLRLSKLKLGYILKFNVLHMRDGVKRVVNNL
ncbi:MAG TPA: GxxExxY protein [Burkholderiales bacterium]|nr:GxxExxY protein [Burkholderiales bacterium]